MSDTPDPNRDSRFSPLVSNAAPRASDPDPDRDSRFAPHASESDPPLASRLAPRASERLVIVAEDDEGLNRVVCKRLERQGLTTVGAHSVADAIAAIRQHPDCLLLLDYMLGDTDAPGLLDKLDKTGLRVPFIVMTGRGDERVAVEMMKLGARDYLVKQPDFLQLVPPVVERVLGQLETERKLNRTEVGLRESEERFRQAFEDSAIGKLFTGLDGRLLRVNRAFAAMLGYSIEELQSLDFQAVTHADDVAESIEVMARLQTGTEGSARFEKRYLHKNGSAVWVDLSTVLLRDAAGQPHHFVADVQDITDGKQAEAELLQHRDHLEELVSARTRELTTAQEQLVLQEKLATLGRVAGTIAHELRNPLGAIRNASYYLQTFAADKLKGKPLRHLQAIDQYVERANAAITMILDFTWRQRGEPKKCALSPLIDRALAEAAAPESVKVRLDVKPGLPDIFVDGRQMVAAFRNLFVNTTQAMPGGGTLHVAARQEGAAIVVDIADTGCGIKPEDFAHLFEPLFTTKDIGMGLGLAICRVFIEENNGTISVASEVGKGTTVTVVLPIADEGKPQTPNSKL